jgi:CRP/FNR family transcriptional regulator
MIAPTTSDLIDQLHSVPHFRGLAGPDLQAIVTAGQVLRYPSDATVFMEGEPCAGLFVLLSGQVHLTKIGPRGHESIMAVINPVIMFNEVPALDGGPNAATAQATQDSQTWQVGYERFQNLMQLYPMIGLGLLRVLAARNRILIAHYEDLSFRSVLARTAKLLLELSQHGKTPIYRRDHSNNELAARVGSVPEAISRSMHEYKKQGAITCNRSAIIVRKPERLIELAQIGSDLLR